MYHGIPGTKIVGYTCDASIYCTSCVPYADTSEKAQDSDGNPIHPVFAADETASETCMNCGCTLLTGEAPKAPYACGDVEIWIDLAGVRYSDVGRRYEWRYKATLNGATLAEGRQLETPFDDPKRAAAELIAFMHGATLELRAELDWTFDGSEFESAIETDDDGRETVYVISEQF